MTTCHKNFFELDIYPAVFQEKYIQQSQIHNLKKSYLQKTFLLMSPWMPTKTAVSSQNHIICTNLLFHRECSKASDPNA